MFMRAISTRSAAIGEAFHTVSPRAVSLRGYAEAVATWFRREAWLEYEPWMAWKEKQAAEDAAATWEHISRSPSSSIEKAQRLLGYAPRYTSFEAVFESLEWLVRTGVVKAQ